MEPPTQNQAKSTKSENRIVTLSPASKEWVMKRISLTEILKPGQALDDFSKTYIAKMWLETLSEIGEERFDAALMHVLKTSSFRPDIVDIRKAAGMIDPLRKECKAKLRILLEGMRSRHGLKLRPIHGAPIYGTEEDPRDKYGERDREPERHMVPFPFEKRTEEALVELGEGNLAAGIYYISKHPSLKQNQDSDEGQYQGDPLRKADSILQAFIEAYREAE